MPDPVTFLIPSIIYISNQPLSYCATRSVYTPEERALQTKEGIESIRNRIPEAKVVMVETGLRPDLPHGLHKMPDEYIYAGSNPIMRRIADGAHKGYGETMALLFADPFVKKISSSYFFKLSGRYRLNDAFDLSRWVGTRDTLVARLYDPNYMCTKLYGFAAEFYDHWRYAMLRALPELRLGWAVENTLPKFIKNIAHLNPVGVTGTLAPYGVGAVE